MDMEKEIKILDIILDVISVFTAIVFILLVWMLISGMRDGSVKITIGTPTPHYIIVTATTEDVR